MPQTPFQDDGELPYLLKQQHPISGVLRKTDEFALLRVHENQAMLERDPNKPGRVMDIQFVH
jgi:hypothetical protein